MLRLIRNSLIGKSALRRASGLSIATEHLQSLESLVWADWLHSENCGKDSEECFAIRLAKLSLAVNHCASISVSMDMSMEQCESPIEKIMLSALLIAAAERDVEGIFVEHWNFAYPGMLNRQHFQCFYIWPQWVTSDGKYRIDFRLHLATFDGIEDGFPKQTKSVELLVECDGHDWHEKTKGQASRDKKKDRDLQKLGHTIFRFSGSDIHKDAIHCANECLDFLGLELIPAF